MKDFTIRLFVIAAFAATGLFLSSGCSIRAYTSQADCFYKPYREGKMQKAASKINKKAPKSNKRDKLLWRLEQGTVLLAADDFDGSIGAFETAEEILADYETRASVNVRAGAAEVTSAVTNPTAIPYKGKTYDKIMLNTYKCLAYLKKGDPTGARVELRRAYQRQKEAVEEHAKEIEQAQEQGKKRNVSYKDAKKSKEFRSVLNSYNELDERNPFAVYVNPLTVYLDGLVHLATSSDASDLERARKSLIRARDMVGAKGMVEPDLELVRKRETGATIQPTVYVIVENGVAPIRKQVSFHFPTPHPKVRFVSTAFPVIRPQTAPYKHFQLIHDGNRIARTAKLASMDAIIVKEFKNELPIMITRIIVNGLVKSIAQHQAEREFGLYGLLGAIAYGVVSNRADLRTWLTLPKEFQFARFERPAGDKLEIRDANGVYLTTVNLPETEMLLVYVKTPNRNSASVQTIKLR